MSNRHEIINVNADSEASSIQITINLGKPLGQPTNNTILPERESQAPQGTFLRQVVVEPGANPVKKIRTSFIPDDLTQDTSTHVADPDPGERSKWRELLKDRVNDDEIDSGDIVMRLNEEGGTVTWLPENASLDPIINRFKAITPGELGGASIGDFFRCWFERGQTAAAATNCWSRL